MLAQRLKEDLEPAGCDPWQFDLSAIPGTDAWGTILERIENSDFFIVLLSKEATASRAVTEEICYAHYCSVQNTEQRPRIIPLTLEDDVAVPRQIARAVRLPFRELQYNSDFEKLLQSLGIEESPFALTADLDATFSRGREFDVKREAGTYVSNLIRHHPDVSALFHSFSADARVAAGGRWFMPSAQTVIWEEGICRQTRQPQFVRTHNYSIMVIYVLHCGHKRGYDSCGRVIAKIAAFEELKYDYVGKELDLVLHSDTLRLKFEGFRQITSAPLLVK